MGLGTSDANHALQPITQASPSSSVQREKVLADLEAFQKGIFFPLEKNHANVEFLCIIKCQAFI